MRVFQIYFSRIHKSQVPFKDMLPFMEDFLQKNGWPYRELLFDVQIQDDLPYIDDLLRKYPYWRPFYSLPNDRSKSSFHRITNAPETKDDLLPDEYGMKVKDTHPLVDLTHLLELMSKVPRPHNFPGFSVKFDGVDWLNSGGEGSISFTRSIWPNGAISEVLVVVELTDKSNPNAIIDDAVLVHRLKEQLFGSLLKPYTGKLVCEFTDTEVAQANISIHKIEPVIAAFRERTKIDATESDLQTLEDVTAFTRYSVKKPIQVYFRDWSYKYEQQGAYFVRKLLNHGYRLDVELMFKPGMNFLERLISISGLSFCFHLAYDRITRSSQEIVSAFVADCHRITDEAEEELVEPLFQLFGDTPSWYFSS